MNRQELRHQGETMLKTLFGSTAQAAGLGHLLTEAAYGAVWSRPISPWPIGLWLRLRRWEWDRG